MWTGGVVGLMSVLQWDDSDARGVRIGRVGWPHSRADLEREWAVVQAHINLITLVPGRLMSDLNGAEHAELGVWAAAAWTLGEVGAGPMTRVEQDLTWAQVQNETDLAEVLSRMHGEQWEYATGALCWLRWVVGDAPTVVHPGW